MSAMNQYNLQLGQMDARSVFLHGDPE